MADFLTCAAAIIAGYYLQFYLGESIHSSAREVLAIGCLHGLIAVLLLQSAGAYRSGKQSAKNS